ncbi:MAG: hypothetical protein LQ340_006128, partial [Diploschistes diacapsis]
MPYLVLVYEDSEPDKVPSVSISAHSDDQEATYPPYSQSTNRSALQPIDVFLESSPSTTRIAFNFRDSRGFHLNVNRPPSLPGKQLALAAPEHGSEDDGSSCDARALQQLPDVRCGESAVSSPDTVPSELLPRPPSRWKRGKEVDGRRGGISKR